MNEVKGQTDRRADTLGLVLFSIGAFLAVLAIMALIKGVPENAASGTMLIAKGLVRGMGAIPGLMLAAGLAGLGAVLFLNGAPGALFRHLGGIAGTALGAALLLGSFSQDGGGAVGGLTASLPALVGFVVGILAVGLPVWFAWLDDGFRQSGFRKSRDSGQGGELSAVLIQESNDGVTPAEAAALIPDPVSEPEAGSEDGLGSESESEVVPMPPSPYPEDVRLRGQIPLGTRPLQSTSAEAAPQGSSGSESVHRWTPQAAEPAEVPSDEDLAPHAAAATHAATPAQLARHAPDAAGKLKPETGASPLAVPKAQAGESALKAEPTEATVAPVAPEGAESFDPKLPPRPSWEQPPLFGEDEHKVDAYGTPVAETAPGVTIEDPAGRPAPVSGFLPSVELEPGEPAATLEVQPALESSATAEDAEDPEEELAHVPPALAEAEALVESQHAASVSGELDQDAPQSPDAPQSSDASQATADAQVAVEEESEDDEDEYEWVYEDEEGEGEYAEDEDEEEEDEEEEEEEEEEDEDGQGSEEYAEDDEEEEEEYEDEEEEEDAEAEYEDEYEDEEEEEHELAAEADEARPVAAEVEETEPEEAGEVAESLESEPEVVLQPRPVSEARVAQTAQPIQSPVEAGQVDVDTVFKAGCMFLEHGRVAVSLIQRKFDLDFDQACEVLDKLQGMGLIGPYLGGQRRDILMTLEEWTEKVTSP